MNRYLGNENCSVITGYLGIVNSQSSLLCRRDISTLPDVVTKPKKLLSLGPIQPEQVFEIGISQDFALLVVALALPSFFLAFLESGRRWSESHEGVKMIKHHYWEAVITHLGTVAHPLAGRASCHVLLLFAAAVTRLFLAVEPIVPVGIIVEFDEFT